MHRELRVEDVCTRRRGKRLVGRRARGVQLEGEVEEVGRHQASSGGICISNIGRKLAWTGLLRRLKESCLRLELWAQLRQWGNTGARHGAFTMSNIR
jgi:hypothetical protein